MAPRGRKKGGIKKQHVELTLLALAENKDPEGKLKPTANCFISPEADNATTSAATTLFWLQKLKNTEVNPNTPVVFPFNAVKPTKMETENRKPVRMLTVQDYDQLAEEHRELITRMKKLEAERRDFIAVSSFIGASSTFNGDVRGVRTELVEENRQLMYRLQELEMERSYLLGLSCSSGSSSTPSRDSHNIRFDDDNDPDYDVSMDYDNNPPSSSRSYQQSYTEAESSAIFSGQRARAAPRAVPHTSPVPRAALRTPPVPRAAPRSPPAPPPPRRSLNDLNVGPLGPDGKVPIGEGHARVNPRVFNQIGIWTPRTFANATRKLLVEVFGRETLATHCLTGKASPAFRYRPARNGLCPNKVNDIVWLVTDRCNVQESQVRSIITTKCSDERKIAKNQALRAKRTSDEGHEFTPEE